MGWTVYNSDGQILQGSSTLADDAVTTAKILDDAVTYAKMQNLVTADRVLGSTSTGLIGEVQIVPDMIATDAVTTVKILNLAVTNAKLADDAVGADELAANAVVNASIASGAAIDATKIANGSVTSAEFQYINTLSSNAQTQISAKHATIDSSARLDASLIGANGNVSNAEYGYLSGVTSDIQTQISAGGKVLQVVSAVKTGSTSVSWESGQPWVDVSGFVVSITPSHNQNKVFVLVSDPSLYRDVSYNYYVTIDRGGTNLGHATYGLQYGYGGSQGIGTWCYMMYLDSPASTSSVTYQVQTKVINSGYIGFVNGSAPSTITAMEIYHRN